MAVSELPGNPNAVWTVRRHVEGKGSLVEAPEVCCVGGPGGFFGLIPAGSSSRVHVDNWEPLHGSPCSWSTQEPEDSVHQI